MISSLLIIPRISKKKKKIWNICEIILRLKFSLSMLNEKRVAMKKYVELIYFILIIQSKIVHHLFSLMIMNKMRKKSFKFFFFL